MTPHIITHTKFDGDIAMDNYVKRIHDEFEGCFDPDGCGRITFMGDIIASTEVVNRERASKSSVDWAEFIDSMGKKVWAIALTLVKQGEHGLYKETVYINSHYSDVIFYTSSWEGYGDTKRSRESYLLVSHILGPVLNALDIRY